MFKLSHKKRFKEIALAALLLIASVLSILPAHAAAPYHVSLTASNFSLRIISAPADDLSDPTHARFSLQNGTPLWYGITIQSTPSGMVPTPANGPGDLITTTFLDSIPLLPPAGVLPFDQTNGSFRFETLKLAVAFSGPNQQMQFDLTPFEPHAVTLDMLALLLQLLGQKNAGQQIGLLMPGALKVLFDATSTMKDFTNLTNDYVQVLRAIPDTKAMLVYAYSWARDLVSLLTDANEQGVLADLLWKVLGKTLPYNSILKTISSFSQAQFGLGMEGFIKDESLILGTLLLQQNDPTILLQTAANTPRPGPTPTQKPSSPTFTPSPAAAPSPTPDPLPRNTPTPRPSALPTHTTTATPTR